MNKIAYLGMGIMGQGMASNLVKGGYNVTVWNRTPDKRKPVVELGAKAAETPAEAVKGAEVIMVCLADDIAVKDVVFGQDGIMSAVQEGQIALDMSTVSPATSLREAGAYAKKGAEFLDAPVFGSKPEAQAGGLWIVVGGKKEILEKVRPILETISESIHHMGETGKGAAMKLVGNMVVAFQLEAIGEAMVMAEKAGLDQKEVLNVLSETDFSSPIFEGVGGGLVERDFSTSFALKHMLKDVNLILGIAENLKSPTPGAAAIRETIKSAVNQGWAEENCSALVKALEKDANVQIGAHA